MTTAKLTSEDTVVNALASASDLISAEIATATGLGRSTVGNALVSLERAGTVHRDPGGRDGRRRLPDRWSGGQADDTSSPASATQRLRPGQLDGLVLDYINSHGKQAAVGATAVAKALGRSGGAVGNCLTRPAAAGSVRKVSDKPRRYRSTTLGSHRHEDFESVGDARVEVVATRPGASARERPDDDRLVGRHEAGLAERHQRPVHRAECNCDARGDLDHLKHDGPAGCGSGRLVRVSRC